MSKRLIVKTLSAYRDADGNDITQASNDVELADPEYVKKLTVDRIVFPKGFLFKGGAQLNYLDSRDNLRTRTIIQAGINARRFLDIYHAAFELHRWVTAINALTADTLQVDVDDSKAFIVIMSTYDGVGATPALWISDISADGTTRSGFSTFVAASLGVPHGPAYMELDTSGTYYHLDWYDSNGGVDEIFMTSEILATFERKYASSFERYELNSCIMTIPAPTIKYQPLAELTDFGDHAITNYFNVNDARLYERQIYNVSDMITPFTISFDSEIALKKFDLHFYADIYGDGLYEVFFPRPVGLVINTESLEAIEKEDELPRLPYEEGFRVV